MMMARHDWFEVIFVFLFYVPAVVVGPGAIEEAPLKLIQVHRISYIDLFYYGLSARSM